MLHSISEGPVRVCALTGVLNVRCADTVDSRHAEVGSLLETDAAPVEFEKVAVVLIFSVAAEGLIVDPESHEKGKTPRMVDQVREGGKALAGER